MIEQKILSAKTIDDLEKKLKEETKNSSRYEVLGVSLGAISKIEDTYVLAIFVTKGVVSGCCRPDSHLSQ